MKKKNWLGLVLSFAAPCKGKLILSTCLQIISVAAGLIPYLAVYRIIQMFFNETASTKGVFLWTGVCLLGYALMLIFHGISTTLSHESAYTILEGLRRKMTDKLMKAPLAPSLINPSGN